MAEKSTEKKFVIRKERLFSLVFGIISFVLLFVNWFKVEFEVMGYSIGSFASTVFLKDAGDAQAMLGVAKVFGIIAIVVGVLYIIAQLIDVERFIPALKNFKFGFYRLFGLVYYGIIELAILFAIIGSIAWDMSNPTVRIFILFVIFAAAIVRFAVPSIWNACTKKLNVTIE